MSALLCLCAVLWMPPPAALALAQARPAAAHDTGQRALNIEQHFRNLRRPDQPNHWLVAPAGYPANPDATAPVFAVPVAALREAFKSVVLQAAGAAVVEDSAAGLHVVVTTRLFGFRDDIRAQFIALGPRQSTLALHSASRVGYWDFGTNRRRVEDWLARTAAAIDSRRP